MKRKEGLGQTLSFNDQVEKDKLTTVTKKEWFMEVEKKSEKCSAVK